MQVRKADAATVGSRRLLLYWSGAGGSGATAWGISRRGVSGCRLYPSGVHADASAAVQPPRCRSVRVWAGVHRRPAVCAFNWCNGAAMCAEHGSLRRRFAPRAVVVRGRVVRRRVGRRSGRLRYVLQDGVIRSSCHQRMDRLFCSHRLRLKISHLIDIMRVNAMASAGGGRAVHWLSSWRPSCPVRWGTGRTA